MYRRTQFTTLFGYFIEITFTKVFILEDCAILSFRTNPQVGLSCCPLPYFLVYHFLPLLAWYPYSSHCTFCNSLFYFLFREDSSLILIPYSITNLCSLYELQPAYGKLDCEQQHKSEYPISLWGFGWQHSGWFFSNSFHSPVNFIF